MRPDYMTQRMFMVYRQDVPTFRNMWKCVQIFKLTTT
jgi:hypothetical protein